MKLKEDSEENDKAIEEVEEKIIAKTEHIYADRVFKALGSITGEDGKINNLGAWRELNKIDPNRKKQHPRPVAFKDFRGNFLTNHENIKMHCLSSILKRLRKRPMHPQLMELEKRKIKLSNLRLQKAKKRKTVPWTVKQMETAIKSMKNKKCRDAQGLINEILKPGVAGKYFKMSLLSLLNKTKEHLKIPQMMKIVNIALIPKTGRRNLLHGDIRKGLS